MCHQCVFLSQKTLTTNMHCYHLTTAVHPKSRYRNREDYGRQTGDVKVFLQSKSSTDGFGA